MENNEKRNHNQDEHNYKMQNNQNRDDQNKEQFEEFSSDQPNFKDNDQNINSKDSAVPNNQNNPSQDIAHKYYGGANQGDEGFLDNSEYNSTNSTFRPDDPKLDEEGYREDSSDSDKVNSTPEFDNFDEEGIYDSIFNKKNNRNNSDIFNVDDEKNKGTNDDISESGYDKKIGMQKRDDSRFK